MQIMAGSINGMAPATDPDRLAVISVVLNNTCNLKCKHCYLEPDMTKPLLTPAEWARFFKSVFEDLQPDIVTFAGKEVFADQQSADVMFRAVEQRNLAQQGSRRTRVGLITNGTLIERFRGRLLQTPPDWIDVSVDGPPEGHDAIRGVGAFARLRPNLAWLMENMGDRVWITHTLMKSNVHALAECVSFFNEGFGVRNFSIGTYRPTTYTDNQLSFLPSDREEQVLRALQSLRALRFASPLRVQFDCDFADPLQSSFAQHGISLQGWPLAQSTEQFDNGITLIVRGMRTPVGLWHAVRISAEGYWLAAEDLLEAKHYRENAVATLADYGFDSRKLHSVGLQHPRFQRLTGTTSDLFLAKVRRAG